MYVGGGFWGSLSCLCALCSYSKENSLMSPSCCGASLGTHVNVSQNSVCHTILGLEPHKCTGHLLVPSAAQPDFLLHSCPPPVFPVTQVRKWPLPVSAGPLSSLSLQPVPASHYSQTRQWPLVPLVSPARHCFLKKCLGSLHSVTYTGTQYTHCSPLPGRPAFLPFL